jgi:aspartate/methionine/tyrosine aminotransferase
MKMKFAERTSRLGTENAFSVLAEVQRLAAQGHDVINLGIGDPDFDTPTHVKEAAVAALAANRTHYSPSAGVPALRDAIVRHLERTRGLGYSPEQVVVVPGGKPILFFSLLAIAEPGDEVIYPNPGFPIYESVITYAGARAVPLPLLEERDFRFDAAALRDLASPRTRMIILNSPSNPTGGVLEPADLEAVAAVAMERDCWVLADEIYSEFLFEGRHHSIAALPGMQERTILLDGFSKTFAMTGWRLGYGAMRADLAAHVARLMTNSVSCTATFVQDAGIAALTGSQEPVRAMIGEFRARRDLVVAGLNRIPGFRCLTPHGAFYAYPNVTGACRRLGVPDAEALQERLLHEAGVAVLARSCFGPRNEGEAEEYVRISFATSRELLEAGLDRIRRYMERQ